MYGAGIRFNELLRRDRLTETVDKLENVSEIRLMSSSYLCDERLHISASLEGIYCTTYLACAEAHATNADFSHSAWTAQEVKLVGHLHDPPRPCNRAMMYPSGSPLEEARADESLKDCGPAEPRLDGTLRRLVT